MKKKRLNTIPKSRHHLWGIKAPHKVEDRDVPSFVTTATWEYIRECSADKRATMNLDIRKYAQLEAREEDTGRTVLVFNCAGEENN